MRGRGTTTSRSHTTPRVLLSRTGQQPPVPLAADPLPTPAAPQQVVHQLVS